MRQIDSRKQEKSKTADMIISRHGTARKMSRARASQYMKLTRKSLPTDVSEFRCYSNSLKYLELKINCHVTEVHHYIGTTIYTAKSRDSTRGLEQLVLGSLLQSLLSQPEHKASTPISFSPILRPLKCFVPLFFHFWLPPGVRISWISRTLRILHFIGDQCHIQFQMKKRKRKH